VADGSDTRIEHKAGIVAYRLGNNGPECLLVTARSVPDSWIFPLGGVEPGETASQAAERECLEESGYVVRCRQLLATIDLQKSSSVHRVSFYLGELQGQVDSFEDDRQRCWVGLDVLGATVPAVFKPVADAAVEVLRGDVSLMETS